jgi:hypothetical protein
LNRVLMDFIGKHSRIMTEKQELYKAKTSIVDSVQREQTKHAAKAVTEFTKTLEKNQEDYAKILKKIQSHVEVVTAVNNRGFSATISVHIDNLVRKMLPDQYPDFKESTKQSPKLVGGVRIFPKNGMLTTDHNETFKLFDYLQWLPRYANVSPAVNDAFGIDSNGFNPTSESHKQAVLKMEELLDLEKKLKEELKKQKKEASVMYPNGIVTIDNKIIYVKKMLELFDLEKNFKEPYPNYIATIDDKINYVKMKLPSKKQKISA